MVLLWFVPGSRATAQNKDAIVTYTGVVADALNHAPVEGCTVTGSMANGKAVAYTLTVKNGSFTLRHAAKVAGITVTHIGYAPLTIAVDAGVTETGASHYALKPILLARDTRDLKEVKIEAAKTAVKYSLNKITYNATLDTGKVRNALELMDYVPLVAVLPNDGIAVAGDQNIRVLLDGKERANAAGFAALLKSLPANTIDKIEINTSPAMKYKQEGVEYVINIITNKKTPKGFYAGLNAKANTRAGAGAGLYGLARYNNVFATAMVNASKEFKYINGGIFKQAYRAAGMPARQLLATSESRNESLMADVAVDYNLSDKQSLRAAFTNYNTGYSSRRNSTLEAGGTTGTVGDQLDNKTTIQNTQLNYENVFKNQSVFSIAAALFRAPQHQEYNSTTNSFRAEGNSDDYTLQADYQLPVKKVTVEVGGKGVWRQLSNNLYATDDYRQDIYRGYASAAYAINDKQQLRAGLTADDIAYRRAGGYEKAFFNLLPQASYSAMLGKQTQLSLSYAMQVTRPGLQMIAPAVVVGNPLTTMLGNENLGSEKWNSFSTTLSGKLFKQPVVVRLIYMHGTNGLVAVRNIAGELITSRYINDVTQEVVQSTIYYSFKPFKNCTVRLDGDLGYRNLQSNSNAGLEKGGVTYRFFPYVSYNTFWDITAQLRFFMYGRVYTTQGYTGAVYDSQFNLGRRFLDGKLRLGVDVYHPFTKTTTSRGQFNDGITQISYSNTTPARYYGINASYDLGSMFTAMNMRARRGKSASQDDLKQ